MLLALALVALLLWALGYFFFPVVGAVIHLLLVVAVIALLIQVVRGRPAP